MRLGLKENFGDYCAATHAGFSHDRTETVGSSEIGKCARMVGYKKAGTAPDNGEPDLKGFAERGNVMEDSFAVPLVEFVASKSGGKVYMAGQANQTTIVNKTASLSATPDGLLVIDGASYMMEFKSFDPRSNTGKFPKFEHKAQVNVAVGLVRSKWRAICKAFGINKDVTPPEGAILVYANASDYSDIHEFWMPFSDASYKGQGKRARTIISASHSGRVEELSPEGKTTGECRNCDFSERCVGYAAMVPTDKAVIPPKDQKRLSELALAHAKAKAEEADAEARRKVAEGEIKEVLYARGSKWADLGVARINWSVTPGRQSFDRKAAEARLKHHGEDPSTFVTEGKPSDKLVIEISAA